MGWCLNFVVYEKHEYNLEAGMGKIMVYSILWKIKQRLCSMYRFPCCPNIYEMNL